MRKVSNTRDETKYCPTYLYRDDIAQIVKILKPHFPNIQISVGDYELDDASELASLGKSYVSTCTIKAGTIPEYTSVMFSPEIELKIWDFAIYLTSADSDNATYIGIKQKIDRIIRKRNDITHKILSNYATAFLCVMTTFLIALNTTFVWNPKPITLFHIILKILVWIMPVCALKLPIRKGGIYTIESTSTTGWWNRNKDSITVGLILTVLGTILGVVLTPIFSGK